MTTHSRQPAPYSEYADNRTAAEIRRDMALLRIHERYSKPVRKSLLSRLISRITNPTKP